jgi:hypothetical protein
LCRLGLAYRLYLPFEFLDAFGLLSCLGLLLEYLRVFGMKLSQQIFDLLLKPHEITLASRNDIFQLTNTPYVGFTFINERIILLIKLRYFKL